MKSLFKQINNLHEENLAPKLEAFAAANGKTLTEGQENSISLKEAKESLALSENYVYAQMTGKSIAGGPSRSSRKQNARCWWSSREIKSADLGVMISAPTIRP